MPEVAAAMREVSLIARVVVCPVAYSLGSFQILWLSLVQKFPEVEGESI